MQVLFDEQLPLVLEANEGLVPYFGVAAAGNFVSGYYQMSD